VVFPIGFVGLFKHKKILTTIFFVGSILDVIVLLIFGAFTSQFADPLYTAVEFIVIIIKVC